MSCLYYVLVHKELEFTSKKELRCMYWRFLVHYIKGWDMKISYRFWFLTYFGDWLYISIQNLVWWFCSKTITTSLKIYIPYGKVKGKCTQYVSLIFFLLFLRSAGAADLVLDVKKILKFPVYQRFGRVYRHVSVLHGSLLLVINP
jgi:hypothetical protein